MVQRCVRGDYLIILYNFHMKAVSKSTVLFHFDSRLMVSSVSKLVGFQIWRCYCVLLAGMVSPDKKSGIAVDKVGFIWVHSFDVHWYIHYIYIYVYMYIYIYFNILTLCSTNLVHHMQEFGQFRNYVGWQLGWNSQNLGAWHTHNGAIWINPSSITLFWVPRPLYPVSQRRLQMASPDFVHLFSSLAGMMTPPGLHILHEGPVT